MNKTYLKTQVSYSLYFEFIERVPYPQEMHLLFVIYEFERLNFRKFVISIKEFGFNNYFSGRVIIIAKLGLYST